jgi:hypothetical protein
MCRPDAYRDSFPNARLSRSPGYERQSQRLHRWTA